MIERIVHIGMVTIVANEKGVITCGTFLVLKAFPVSTDFPLDDYMAGYEYICKLEEMGYIQPIKCDRLIVVREL